MLSRLMNPKHDRTRLRRVRLAVAGLASLIAAADHAAARSDRSKSPVELVASRAAGEPIMAVVSLRRQRITVYDAHGWIMRAPVSSGTKGRETPAGIFSVLQKNAEHYSNLYDDAYMPHMQRITWSGLALHGGHLPGYPASHGCIRMPFDFAARLFDVTRLGMRVIVAPGDVTPTEIAHPVLHRPRPQAAARAAALAAEAERASRTADRARLAAVTASRELARSMMPVRVAENLKLRAEEELAAAETALGSASSSEARERAEAARARAVGRIAELQVQAAVARAALQPKADAVAAAREAAVAAEATRVAAVAAAREMAHELEPMSVFISRKTQRLYARRAFQPVIEAPVTIVDPDRPIGTHVFTAMEWTGGDTARWSVVSLVGGATDDGAAEPRAAARGAPARDVGPPSTSTGGAMAALDRILIAPDVWDRIAGMASPRSSLIISDEELSHETGPETEFVAILSGEPQGSMRIRRRAPGTEARYGLPR